MTLFEADQAGFWLYEEGAHQPFRLAAQQDLSPALGAAAARIRSGDPSNGVDALRERRIRILSDPANEAPSAYFREAYRHDGIATACLIPVVFRDTPLGLLAVYHGAPHPWPQDEQEMARAFTDRMATAISHARLFAETQELAARLRAIADLSARLNRIQDVRGIGEAIVAEVGSLIDFDNIRVYRVDHATALCEPVAFHGTFMGTDEPSADLLRVAVGEGLTGWVAEHAESLVVGDGAADPRHLIVGPIDGPESLLLVPMLYDDRVEGIIVVSKLGRDRFTASHEAILSIFAGHAAQALVNADAAQRVRRQQEELERRLASQRRLLEVNTTLLSTLDPVAVLEQIADALKAVVAYDTLSIYRVDRAAAVRRAVVARDRFAEVILQHESPIDTGVTGWVIARNEAVCCNDAHLDPRAVQIPGTPFEPESMIVVPLAVNGEVIGTLNVGRMGGEEAHFDETEFELTQLFAGQASIALQNAETHRAVEVRAAHDALTGLGNHPAFQSALASACAAGPERPFAVLMMDLDRFKRFNDTHGHPAGDGLLRAIGGAIAGAVREGDRPFRYGGDEFAILLPRATRATGLDVGDRIRRAVAAITAGSETEVSISVGVACFPRDGRTADDLVASADAALFFAKPSAGRETEDLDGPSRDVYLTALSDTAVALMDRLDPTELLETIVSRAASLVGTPDGFLDLVEPESGQLEVRVAFGLHSVSVGERIPADSGVTGRVRQTGRAFAVDDYDTWDGRIRDLPDGLGPVVGVPLTSAGEVVGVLGLSSGSGGRTFGEREIAVLERFAQLASLALDNANLFATVQREVVERTVAEAALRESEERFRHLSDAATEALAIHRDGLILEANAAFCRLLGYGAEELIGRHLLEFTTADPRAHTADITADSAEPIEMTAVDRSGAEIPVEVTWRTVPYRDELRAGVVSVRDLRERRRLQDELSRSAFYDPVTGLPNRALFLDRVTHALGWVRPDNDEPIGVILLDLDRFKVINESLGHVVGDRVLDAVGQRLIGCLRPGDTVSRFGGDEFAILLDPIDGPDGATRVAERIETVFSTPIDLDGRDAFVSASMGIVVGRAGLDEPGDLLRDAEIALHRAKSGATVRHAFFEPGMSAATIERLDFENGLRRAVERDQLRLHYQPIVDLPSGRIVGFEALARWQHPTRGLVPPLAFVPLAEETGLIVPIGAWVLETACRQARAWGDALGGDHPPFMSVNLSPRQFDQPDLVETIAEVLRSSGLAPESLELEITESVLMDRSDTTTAALHGLRDLGVRLVLDDFGTGYSSLSYLRHLPIDTLKVDRSFVTGLTGDDAHSSIVEAIVALAHGLGMSVTAEGIESAAQLAWLREHDCDRGQGFLYARPLPAAQAGARLRADRARGGRSTGGPLPGLAAGRGRRVAR